MSCQTTQAPKLALLFVPSSQVGPGASVCSSKPSPIGPQSVFPAQGPMRPRQEGLTQGGWRGWSVLLCTWLTSSLDCPGYPPPRSRCLDDVWCPHTRQGGRTSVTSSCFCPLPGIPRFSSQAVKGVQGQKFLCTRGGGGSASTPEVSAWCGGLALALH